MTSEGRPPSPATGLTVPVGEQVQVSGRIDAADAERLDRVAERRGWTRSQTLRYLIRVALEAEDV